MLHFVGPPLPSFLNSVLTVANQAASAASFGVKASHGP
jgi:hypothetical protein